MGHRWSALVALWAWSGPASAGPVVEVTGDSSLAPCLADEGCDDRVRTLMGDTMDEYGLLIQYDPVGYSALGGKGRGPVAEFRFDSAVLGPRNELERTGPLFPGLPRFGWGWLLGPEHYDGRTPQLGFGTTVLPSLRLDDRLLTTVQVDASLAVPVVGHFVWLGAEAGYGASLVRMPLFGTESQIAGVEEATGFEVEERPTCEGRTCRDRHRQRATFARVGVSVEPRPEVFAYSRVALANVVSHFDVAYDGTTWSLQRLQVQSQSGVGLRLGAYQIAAGAVVVPRHPELVGDGGPTMVKLTANTSWRFGPSRVPAENETRDSTRR